MLLIILLSILTIIIGWNHGIQKYEKKMEKIIKRITESYEEILHPNYKED